MLDLPKVRAIGLDLDDTLWPIWPVITRADAQMQSWLGERAPAATRIFSDADARLALREQVVRTRPDLAHDMSALRLETIRMALENAGEDARLAEPAFDVFFEHRMQVQLFDDVLPALRALAQRYPIVAISNGNADVVRVGLGEYFAASMSAHRFGVGKPDTRIFHAAAQAVGVRPEEVLHVGDDPELDVLGGNKAGMQTCWINRTGHAWRQSTHPHVSVADMGELCRLLGLSS